MHVKLSQFGAKAFPPPCTGVLRGLMGWNGPQSWSTVNPLPTIAAEVLALACQHGKNLDAKCRWRVHLARLTPSKWVTKADINGKLSAHHYCHPLPPACFWLWNGISAMAMTWRRPFKASSPKAKVYDLEKPEEKKPKTRKQNTWVLIPSYPSLSFFACSQKLIFWI